MEDSRGGINRGSEPGYEFGICKINFSSVIKNIEFESNARFDQPLIIPSLVSCLLLLVSGGRTTRDEWFIDQRFFDFLHLEAQASLDHPTSVPRPTATSHLPRVRINLEN